MPLFDDSRAAWGAAKSTNPRYVAPSARVGCSWHYPGGGLSITPSSSHQLCLNQVRSWQKAHQAKGWADIGYNLLICQHVRVIEGRGADYQGSHSPGVNYSHYGIQFMVSGTQAPTAAMYARAVTLRAALEARSGHTLRQWGHRDDPKASTACPGDTIEAWVKAGGPYKASSKPSTTPAPAPAPEKDDIMAMTAAERAALVKEIAEATRDAVLWAPTFPGQEGTLGASSIRNNIGVGASTAQATLAAVQALAKNANVDIDEKALAAELVAGIAPQVTSAVEAAVAKLPQGAPASEIAEAVMGELSKALAPPQA